MYDQRSSIYRLRVAAFPASSNARGVLNSSLLLFLCINLICSEALLVAILAAILDLEMTCILKIIFHGFIGSGMVKNISIGTNIVTLFAIFMELCPF